MSIRNKDMANIIRECDYYKNLTNRDKYTGTWTMVGKSNYINRKCNRLLRTKLIKHPIIRNNYTDNIFSYKVNQPMMIYGKLRPKIKEFFGENYLCNKICISVILIIFIITITTFFY